MMKHEVLRIGQIDGRSNMVVVDVTVDGIDVIAVDIAKFIGTGIGERGGQ